MPIQKKLFLSAFMGLLRPRGQVVGDTSSLILVT